MLGRVPPGKPRVGSLTVCQSSFPSIFLDISGSRIQGDPHFGVQLWNVFPENQPLRPSKAAGIPPVTRHHGFVRWYLQTERDQQWTRLSAMWSMASSYLQVFKQLSGRIRLCFDRIGFGSLRKSYPNPTVKGFKKRITIVLPGLTRCAPGVWALRHSWPNST